MTGWGRPSVFHLPAIAVSRWGARGAARCRCFTGAEQAGEEREEQKVSCPPQNEVKVDPEEKKNKVNLTATAVLMSGWADSEGRRVFVSQSW